MHFDFVIIRKLGDVMIEYSHLLEELSNSLLSTLTGRWLSFLCSGLHSTDFLQLTAVNERCLNLHLNVMYY